MGMIKILIIKVFPVNTLTPSSIFSSDISCLYQYTRNNFMEDTVFIMKFLFIRCKSLFAGTETFKVFTCFRGVVKKLNYDSSDRTTMLKFAFTCYVEINIREFSTLTYSYHFKFFKIYVNKF